MSAYNIGVIGAGSISEYHLKAYASQPDVTISAICDLNEERARVKAEKYGIPKMYADYRELLSDPAVQAVSICTWNNSHAELSIAALEAGKHVLVEKPLCRTVEEALRVEDAVRRTGNILQVGFVRRFATNTQVAKSFIDAGELGEIYYAKAAALRRLGNPGGWFADVERSGGGPLIDIGVHMIDMCWYLMGKPKVASIVGNTYHKLGNRSNIQNLNAYRASDYDPEQNTVEDLANGLIRFENGASLYIDASFSLHAKKNESCAALFGEKGGVELAPELTFITEKHDTILNVEPQINHRTLDIDNAFHNEIEHFVHCARTGKKPISPVEDGVEMMKMLCGIYESARERREICFE
jgi:predicted dehydrogenase